MTGLVVLGIVLVVLSVLFTWSMAIAASERPDFEWSEEEGRMVLVNKEV